MFTSLVIPNDTSVNRVTITSNFGAVCSVGLAPFSGTVEVTYRPKDVLLEFEAFEEWLREISTDRTTIEGFAQGVFDKLNEVLPDSDLFIRVSAQTQVHGPVVAEVAQ